MTRSALAVLAVFLLSAAPALADTKPRIAPPPLRTEAMTLKPGPGHVWVPGYWKWSKVNYVWVDGGWVKAKPNRVWVPGEWKQVGSFWAWTPGRWEKVKAATPKTGEKERKK